jgi:hypothetical protein
MMKVAKRCPTVPGVKATWIPQLVPGATVLHWPAATWKSEALAPPKVKPDIERMAFPVLDIVTAS